MDKCEGVFSADFFGFALSRSSVAFCQTSIDFPDEKFDEQTALTFLDRMDWKAFRDYLKAFPLVCGLDYIKSFPLVCGWDYLKSFPLVCGWGYLKYFPLVCGWDYLKSVSCVYLFIVNVV